MATGSRERGVYFAKAFHSGSLDKLMPEKALFYPWAMIREIRPAD